MSNLSISLLKSYPKEHNWLLAIILNTCNKLTTHETLSDLDEFVISNFRDRGFSDDELKEVGSLNQSIPLVERENIFPGKFANISPSSSYSIADCQTDLTRLISSNNLISFSSTQDSSLPPPSSQPSQEQLQAVTAQYTLKAMKFKCEHEDSIGDRWQPFHDQVFWTFSTISLQNANETKTTNSHIFENVDHGETKEFRDSEGWIWGSMNSPRSFPKWADSGRLCAGTMVFITAWEHDSGNPDKVAKAVDSACATAAGLAVGLGDGYIKIGGLILTALIPAINAIVKKIAENDLIDSAEWMIDRSYLMSNFAGGPKIEAKTIEFKGGKTGKAREKLTLNLRRFS